MPRITKRLGMTDATKASTEMRIVITGGAGFIGSNLVDVLLAAGNDVVAIDNFSTGREEFIASAQDNPAFSLRRLDLVADATELAAAFEGADAVIHLAANADVRFGWNAPRRDLEQNVVATLNVLDAMRASGVRRLLFSSTGSVYGETPQVPTTEMAPFPEQTSLYGASKAAAEGFISAWAAAGYLSATVFRFVSILGPRYTHGHVIDFAAQLAKDPTVLRVLGDGTQRKSYLDVTDCVAAIQSRIAHTPSYELFNLGVDDLCTVTDSIGWITKRLGVSPRLEFTGGRQGWIGDNPLIHLATDRIQSTGWRPQFTIREAVERTVDFFADNRWVVDEHRVD